MNYHSNGGDDDDETENSVNINMKCDYYDIDDLSRLSLNNHGYRCSAIHLNIRSLPSKCDQLETLLSNINDKGIHINFILLCETFLTDINCSMFPLPGYNFICRNRTRGRGGGVAMYISE